MPSDRKIKIDLKTLSNQSISLDVKESDTFEKIKMLLVSMKYPPQEQECLTLPDIKTMKIYSIQQYEKWRKKRVDSSSWETKYYKHELETQQEHELESQREQEGNTIRYRKFIHTKQLMYAMADNRRTIPSVVDGLKTVERKILFTMLKEKQMDVIK
ncbi:hypothetical protein RYX36_003231, partial [Vicia faba]